MAFGGYRIAFAVEPLPPALAERPGAHGRARDGSSPRLVARDRASGQGWRQNEYERNSCWRNEDSAMTNDVQTTYIRILRFESTTRASKSANKAYRPFIKLLLWYFGETLS